MNKDNDPTYKLHINLRSNDKMLIENVLCEIFVPNKKEEKIKVVLYPDKKTEELPFIGSLSGIICDFENKPYQNINADKVYIYDQGQRIWGPEIIDRRIICEPVDLSVITLLPNALEVVKEDETIGHFWITKLRELQPRKGFKYKYTGEISLDTSTEVIINYREGVNIIFDEYYKISDTEKWDTIRSSELVAKWEGGIKQGEINEVLKDIDDLLSVASLGGRKYCTCIGYKMYTKQEEIEYFRKDRHIPSDQNYDTHDRLVERREFNEYLQSCYDNLKKSKNKRLLLNAIYTVLNKEGTLESTFLSRFSSLESLVSFFEYEHIKLKMLNDTVWKTVKKDITAYLKGHKLLSENEEKLKTLINKIPELNKVSFADRFGELCKHYEVYLSDLWPVIKVDDGKSLYAIRNKLSHGESLEVKQIGPLSIANEHLKWVLERILLAILGWPMSKSSIHADFLNKYSDSYKNWKTSQMALKS